MRRNTKLLKQEEEEFEKEKIILTDKVTSSKEKLITDLKRGLGDEIKKNPRKVKIIKKSLFQRFVIFIKKLFTKF